MDKFKKEYREKFKLRLVFTAAAPTPFLAVPQPMSAPRTQSDSIAKTASASAPTTVIGSETNLRAEESDADLHVAYSANLQAM